MCADISAYIGAWEHMRPPKGEHIAYHICQFEEHILARPIINDVGPSQSVRPPGPQPGYRIVDHWIARRYTV
jgi:hypothetical protein